MVSLKWNGIKTWIFIPWPMKDQFQKYTSSLSMRVWVNSHLPHLLIFTFRQTIFPFYKSSFFLLPYMFIPRQFFHLRTYSFPYLSLHVDIYLLIPPSYKASLKGCFSWWLNTYLLWIKQLVLDSSSVTSCVTLRKLFNISEPTFPYLKNRDNHSA